jgi:hypothetical protein
MFNFNLNGTLKPVPLRVLNQFGASCKHNVSDIAAQKSD